MAVVAFMFFDRGAATGPVDAPAVPRSWRPFPSREDEKISTHPHGNEPDFWSGYPQQPQTPQQPQYPQQPSYQQPQQPSYQQEQPYQQPQYDAPSYPQQPQHGGSQYGGTQYGGSQYEQQSQFPPPYQQPGGFPGQPFPAGPVQPPRRRSRTPVVILAVVASVVVLVCALSVVFISLGDEDSPDPDRAAGAASEQPTASAPAKATGTATPRPTPTATGTASPGEESIRGDLTKFKVGDCLTITGAENSVNPAKCTDSGAYKVLLRRDGTTDDTVCDNTDATEVLYQDATGTSKDLVLCVAPAK